MRLFRSTLLLMLAAAVVPSVVLGFVLLREAHATVSLRAAALAGAATLGVALPLSAWFARRLARPVLECVRGALDIARGRFGRQVTVTVRNEIGELAYTFNHMSRQLESYDRENRALIAALEAGYLATLRSLVSAIDAKDPSTRGHSDRVAELAVAVGRELGVDDVELKALAYGGLLHDVGKIGIPEALLHKAGRLAPAELEQMRAHPAIGADILRGVAFLEAAAPAVRSHHERWDGTGYPDRLAGEAIPLVARVVNAADTFDACTSVRPYQEAIPAEAALDVLQRLRGTQIDPTVCDALVRVMRRRVPAAQAPELATGST
ncbi:MAG TPA: HD domain-containing phosphohydrolase [Anaeromyxobacteraceae bacterium]|nr:HD domain-containing phosphohydrolase [Anaeromyxobacteraceae bacterium]